MAEFGDIWDYKPRNVINYKNRVVKRNTQTKWKIQQKILNYYETMF